MDLEVQRAYRTLQRAGITIMPMSPEMSLAELSNNYGKLMYQWIQRQGVTVRLLRTQVNRYQTDLQQLFVGSISAGRGTVPVSYPHSHTQVPINLPDDASEEDIQAAYWCNLTPTAIPRLFQTMDSFPCPDDWQKVVVVVLFTGGVSAAQGFIYGCRPRSDAEKAQEEARLAKAAAKAARDAENRRKRQEAKEKEQLKKLVTKYGKDAIEDIP